jgi:hypothetical protein
VSRQRAADLALSADEIVIRRNELDLLHDDLFVLACAVDDVERDLATGSGLETKELRESLDWLLAAAKPLRDRELSAPGIPPPLTS